MHLRDTQLLVEQDESRFVAKQLAHGHAGLAVLCELGPVASDRCVVVEPATRVRQRKRHGSQALGAGHEDDQRVFVPRRVALGRAAATPQVDDFLAAPIRRDGSADLAALFEVTLELGAYLFEAWSDEPGDVGFRAVDCALHEASFFRPESLIARLHAHQQSHRAELRVCWQALDSMKARAGVYRRRSQSRLASSSSRSRRV